MNGEKSTRIAGESSVAVVPYTLIPVNMADMPFGKVPHARWAEPDIEATAEILRGIHREMQAVPGMSMAREATA